MYVYIYIYIYIINYPRNINIIVIKENILFILKLYLNSILFKIFIYEFTMVLVVYVNYFPVLLKEYIRYMRHSSLKNHQTNYIGNARLIETIQHYFTSLSCLSLQVWYILRVYRLLLLKQCIIAYYNAIVMIMMLKQ